MILKLIELFGANTSIESDDFAFDIRQVPVSEVELVMALTLVGGTDKTAADQSRMFRAMIVRTV